MILMFPPRTGRLFLYRDCPDPPGMKRVPRVEIARLDDKAGRKKRWGLSLTIRTRRWSCNTQLYRRTASRERALHG